MQRLEWGGNLSYQDLLCEAAARSGQLEELNMLRESGAPWNFRTCWAAAAGGHLEVLQCARANGCARDRFTCSEAAACGHLGILQWACANGCPWDDLTCSEAALGGHLEERGAAVGARENGYLWSVWICQCAAKGGHLEVLKWLRGNGCLLTWSVCESFADYHQHLDVLSWVRQYVLAWLRESNVSVPYRGRFVISRFRGYQE